MTSQIVFGVENCTTAVAWIPNLFGVGIVVFPVRGYRRERLPTPVTTKGAYLYSCVSGQVTLELVQFSKGFPALVALVRFFPM